MRTRTLERFLKKLRKKYEGTEKVLEVTLRNKNVIAGYVEGPYNISGEGYFIQIHDGNMRLRDGGSILLRDIAKIEESTLESLIKRYWGVIALCRKPYDAGREIAKALPFSEG